MKLSKKTIRVVLLAAILCCNIAVVCSAETDANESKNSIFSKYGSQDGEDSNLAGKSKKNLEQNGLFYKMIQMVLLVLVFGAVAIYLSRKLLPKISRLPGKKVQVSETVHLGHRRAVHVIKVGKRRLLIGSTNEHITNLADVTDQFFDLDLPATPKENS